MVGKANGPVWTGGEGPAIQTSPELEIDRTGGKLLLKERHSLANSLRLKKDKRERF